MVVAAVISLQDPLGSGPDDICTWIEVHALAHVVHAPARASVKEDILEVITTQLVLCAATPMVGEAKQVAS